MEFAAALLGIAALFMVIYGAICRIVERRAMRRIRETERNAAFIDARNLAVEYRNPTKDGGHVYRPPHGHSLSPEEKVRRHVCCWFHEDAGAGCSLPQWAAVYITDQRLLIRLPGSSSCPRGRWCRSGGARCGSLMPT